MRKLIPVFAGFFLALVIWSIEPEGLRYIQKVVPELEFEFSEEEETDESLLVDLDLSGLEEYTGVHIIEVQNEQTVMELDIDLATHIVDYNDVIYNYSTNEVLSDQEVTEVLSWDLLSMTTTKDIVDELLIDLGMPEDIRGKEVNGLQYFEFSDTVSDEVVAGVDEQNLKTRTITYIVQDRLLKSVIVDVMYDMGDGVGHAVSSLQFLDYRG